MLHPPQCACAPRCLCLRVCAPSRLNAPKAKESRRTEDASGLEKSRQASPPALLDEAKAQQAPASSQNAGPAENNGQDFTRPENLFQLRDPDRARKSQGLLSTCEGVPPWCGQTVQRCAEPPDAIQLLSTLG